MWSPEIWYGGAFGHVWPGGDSVKHVPEHGARVRTYKPAHDSDTVSLPDARRLQKGHGLFLIINETGSAHTLHIVSRIGAVGSVEVITALNPGERALLSLKANDTEAGTWVGRMSTG